MSDSVSLFADLSFAQVRLLDAVESRLRADAGMETSSFLPLLAVSEHEGARVQDVAHALGISVGGASKAVDRLERAGWVKRKSHPTDRRSSTISLTAAGRRALLKGGKAVEAAVDGAVTLAATKRTAFEGALAQLRTDLTV